MLTFLEKGVSLMLFLLGQQLLGFALMPFDFVATKIRDGIESNVSTSDTTATTAATNTK